MLFDHITEHDLDLLLVTETWLTKTNEERVKAELLPDGYKMVHHMRPARRGGGVGLIYKSNLSVKAVNTQQPESFELLDVMIEQGRHCLQLLVVYRPHKIASFHEEIAELLTQHASNHNKVLIVGDFNIHWDVHDDYDARKLRSTLDETGFYQHVTWPTHVAGHTLDLIISKTEESIVESAWPTSLLSDHIASHGRLHMMKPPRERKVVTSRCYKRLDHNALAVETERTLQLTAQLNEGADERDLDNAYDRLLEDLKEMLDRHAPCMTREMTIRPDTRWMTDTILDAKREKRKCERVWRNTQLQVHLEAYKRKRDELTNLIQNARMRYEEGRVTACGNDQKALFRLTKSLIQSEQPTCQLTSAEMSAFFDDKITKIKASLPAPETAISPDSFDDRTEARLPSFSPVSVKEVEMIIKKSASKSCELDPWPTWLLKRHLPLLVNNIANIINASLSNNHVPTQMKQALVRPTLKKPSLDPSEAQSYRPVSNLSFISKILEKVVCTQLTKYLDANQLHHPFQSAYRTRHSVETALIKVQSDIASALDSKKHVVLVMLDLSAAFDTVDHHILLQRMRVRFGLGDDAIKWMTSYLDKRIQKVKVGSSVSPGTIMKCGIPQGSVLGPIMFSMYITPLQDIARKFHVHTHQYADDCQLYVEFMTAAEESKQKIEQCVNSISGWMAANRLKLNETKTELVIFSPPTITPPLIINTIRVVETEIAPVDNVKDLGFYLQKHLNAERQVNALCSSTYYQIANIASIRKCLSQASAEKLIHAFISSRLDFCNALYVGLPMHLLKKMQRIQYAAARILTRTSRRQHMMPVLQQLHWLPIKQRIDYKVATIVWKCIHGEAPTYLSEMISEYVPPRNLRSESERRLSEWVPRTTLGKRSFRHAAPCVWNKLPTALRNENSYEAFKQSLKTVLFNIAFTQ